MTFTMNATVPATASTAHNGPGWQGVFNPSAAGGASLNMVRTKVHGTQRAYLALDDSGSIRGAKAAATNAAANDMLSYLAAPGFRDGFLVSLITFDDTASVHLDHVKPSASLNQAVVTGKGGTDVYAALCELNRMRTAWVPDPNLHEVAPPVFIVMSDGCTTNSSKALEEAERAKQAGVTIVAVGFGSDADGDFMTRLASSPAHYKFAATADDLREFFAQVGSTLRDSQRSGTAPGPALANSLRNQ